MYVGVHSHACTSFRTSAACLRYTYCTVPINGTSGPVTVLRVFGISIQRHAGSVKLTLQKQEIRK